MCSEYGNRRLLYIYIGVKIINMDTFRTFTENLTDLIGNTITGLLLTIAVALFFWSIIRFLIERSKGGPALDDAKNRLGWSVVALAVMFSIWGIVTFLQTGFGFTETSITAPTIQTGGATGGTTGSGGGASASSYPANRDTRFSNYLDVSTCISYNECPGRCTQIPGSTQAYCRR
jgi:hypothetical protein